MKTTGIRRELMALQLAADIKRDQARRIRHTRRAVRNRIRRDAIERRILRVDCAPLSAIRRWPQPHHR